MSSLVNWKNVVLGNGPVTKSTGTLAATTVDLFVVAGGMVALTGIWGKATTAITVANSYKLTTVPTAGDAGDLTTATDIGTADTALGTILGLALGTTSAPPTILKNGGGLPAPMILVPGKIKSVSLGTDGVILWHATWFPIDSAATLTAA